ncbi:MAG: tripartite tricarboxylate transporter substrate binding protein [Deltaproteobacteria bacterium]|nr:tripartite tricarboxylate transporter substrate binding protein [Deltaproteobacteria bacterium]
MARLFRAVIIGLVAPLLFGTAVHAEFPEKNINSIVTFSPGGGFDTISRAITRFGEKYLPKGVKMIVKNVTGAGGITGTVYLYRSKPDGYTIGQLHGGMMAVPYLRGARNTGYDYEKFTWVARVGGEPYALLLRKDSKYRSLEDLQAAKRVTWGVEAVGVGRWVDAYIAAAELGINFAVVSGYRGTGENLPGLLRGDYDVFLQPIDHPSVVPYLQTGEIRPVLTLGPKRAINAPDVPTAIDAGHNITVASNRHIAAPPGTPAKVVKALETLLLKAMNDKDYDAFIKKSGLVLDPGGTEQANKDIQGLAALYRKYADAMKKAITAK